MMGSIHGNGQIRLLFEKSIDKKDHRAALCLKYYPGAWHPVAPLGRHQFLRKLPLWAQPSVNTSKYGISLRVEER